MCDHCNQLQEENERLQNEKMALREEISELRQMVFGLRATHEATQRHLRGVLSHLRTLGVDTRSYVGDWSGVPTHE